MMSVVGGGGGTQKADLTTNTGPENNACTWLGEVGPCCCLPLLHCLQYSHSQIRAFFSGPECYVAVTETNVSRLKK